jgi:hypothetical protein
MLEASVYVSVLDWENVMDGGSPHPRIVEKSATDARQGATTGRVRWILAISLFGAIVALAIAYWVT